MADIGWNADIWVGVAGWYCRDCGAKGSGVDRKQSPLRENMPVIPMSGVRAHMKSCAGQPNALSAAALTSHRNRPIAITQQSPGHLTPITQ